MSFQRALAATGGRVPQPDRSVSAAGRNKPAVGREGHRSDLATKKSLKKSVLAGDRPTITRTVDGFTGPEGSHPWPSSVRWQEPAESHSRIVLSALPEASSRPSGEKTTEETILLQNSSKS